MSLLERIEKLSAAQRNTEVTPTPESSIPLSKLKDAFTGYILEELQFQARESAEARSAISRLPVSGEGSKWRYVAIIESQDYSQEASKMRVRVLGSLAKHLTEYTGFKINLGELQQKAVEEFESQKTLAS